MAEEDPKLPVGSDYLGKERQETPNKPLSRKSNGTPTRFQTLPEGNRSPKRQHGSAKRDTERKNQRQEHSSGEHRLVSRHYPKAKDFQRERERGRRRERSKGKNIHQEIKDLKLKLSPGPRMRVIGKT
jgi:hypothetical protein